MRYQVQSSAIQMMFIFYVGIGLVDKTSILFFLFSRRATRIRLSVEIPGRLKDVLLLTLVFLYINVYDNLCLFE